MPQLPKTSVDRIAYISLAVSVGLLVTVCFASLELTKKTTNETLQDRKVKKALASNTLPTQRLIREVVPQQEPKYLDSLKTIQSLDHTLDLLTTRLEAQKEERDRIERHYQDQLRALKVAQIQEQEESFSLRSKLSETEMALTDALASQKLLTETLNDRVAAVEKLKAELKEKEDLLTYASDKEKLEHQNFKQVLFEKSQALEELTEALNVVSVKAVAYEKEMLGYRQKLEDLEISYKSEKLRAEEMTAALEKAFIEYSRELEKIGSLEASLQESKLEFSSTTQMLNVALAEESSEKEELRQRLWNTQNSLVVVEQQMEEQEARLNKTSEEYQELQKALVLTTKESEELKGALASLEKKLTDSTNIIQEQNDSLAKERNEFDALQKALTLNSLEKEELKAALSSLEKKLTESLNLIEEQTTSLAQKKNEYEELQKAFALTSNEKEELKGALSSLEKKLTESLNLIEEQGSSLAQKKNEYEELQKAFALTSNEKEELKAALSSLEKKLTESLIQLEEQEHLVEQKGKEFEALTLKEMAARKELKKEFSEREQELETIAFTLNTAFEENAKEREQLKEKIATLENSLLSTTQRILDQEERYLKTTQAFEAKLLEEETLKASLVKEFARKEEEFERIAHVLNVGLDESYKEAERLKNQFVVIEQKSKEFENKALQEEAAKIELLKNLTLKEQEFERVAHVLNMAINDMTKQRGQLEEQIVSLEESLSKSKEEILGKEAVIHEKTKAFEELVLQEEKVRKDLVASFSEKEQELERITHTLNAALGESAQEKGELKAKVLRLEETLTSAEFHLKEQEELFNEEKEDLGQKMKKLAHAILKQKERLEHEVQAHEEQKARFDKYVKALEKTQMHLKEEQEKSAFLAKQVEESSHYKEEQKAALELNEKLSLRLEKYSKALEKTQEVLKEDQEKHLALTKELEETKSVVKHLENELLQAKAKSHSQNLQFLDETASLLEETNAAYSQEVAKTQLLEEEISKLRGALSTLESKLGVVLSSTLTEE